MVCNGAKKAIFVRGLPEMSIKGIHLENMTFKTDEGIDLIEAKGITLKNITLDVKDDKKLINVENANDIVLDHINSLNPTNLFLGISGEKTGNVQLLNTTTTTAKKKVDFTNGADSKALIIK